MALWDADISWREDMYPPPSLNTKTYFSGLDLSFSLYVEVSKRSPGRQVSFVKLEKKEKKERKRKGDSKLHEKNPWNVD